jgi:hypothetical protein
MGDWRERFVRRRVDGEHRAFAVGAGIGSDLKSALEAELRHVLKQQAVQDAADALSNARRWINALIGENLSQPVLNPRDFTHFWMCWAFASRIGQPSQQQ